MRRSRRRALGFAAAVMVHLLAALALLPVVGLRAPDRGSPPDVYAPLMIVQLVHLRSQRVLDAAQPPQDEPSASRSKTVSLPDQPAPFNVAVADPEAAVLSVPDEPVVVDDDPLYRAPFRDAVGQASARLRAGLDCAHVDMSQLPRNMLDLCQAAHRMRDEGRTSRGPLS